MQSNLGTLRDETCIVYQIYQIQERGEVPEIAHLPIVIQSLLSSNENFLISQNWKNVLWYAYEEMDQNPQQAHEAVTKPPMDEWGNV